MNIYMQPKTTAVVELNMKEIELIRDLTQNSISPETNEQANIRKQLFVGASRILGYNMDEDGNIARNPKIDFYLR